MESTLNVLVAVIKIDLYKCSRYDAVFSCQANSKFATGLTDINCKYTFAGNEVNKSDAGIIVKQK